MPAASCCTAWDTHRAGRRADKALASNLDGDGMQVTAASRSCPHAFPCGASHFGGTLAAQPSLRITAR